MDTAAQEKIVAVAKEFVGGKFFLDFAVDGTKPPYITYNDQPSDDVVLQGDGKDLFRHRSYELNLWQQRQKEDPALLERITSALNGMVVPPTAGNFHTKVKLESVVRVPEPKESNITHHVITVTHPYYFG